jgi:hypothetical protein
MKGLSATVIVVSFLFAAPEMCDSFHLARRFGYTDAGGRRYDLSTHICDMPTMTLDLAENYTATIKTAKGEILTLRRGYSPTDARFSDAANATPP